MSRLTKPKLATYTASHIIYNIWLHPLRNFPGPLLARSTLLWRVFHSTRGKMHLAIQAEHYRHGMLPVPTGISINLFRAGASRFSK